jgi:cytochrome P450
MSQPLNLDNPSSLTAFCSFQAFGNPSKKNVFFQNAARWLPNGLITWHFKRNQSPRLVKLRQNRDEAHRVARKLIDAKREELKAGTSRRDLMSLLGSPPPKRNRKSGAHAIFQSKRVLLYNQNWD